MKMKAILLSAIFSTSGIVAMHQIIHESITIYNNTNQDIEIEYATLNGQKNTLNIGARESFSTIPAEILTSIIVKIKNSTGKQIATKEFKIEEFWKKTVAQRDILQNADLALTIGFLPKRERNQENIITVQAWLKVESWKLQN